jgi:SAM-dependent methyltransferase
MILDTVKRSIFKVIYKLYLWSAKSSDESFLGSRYIEYPYVIKQIIKLIPRGSKVLLIGCAGDPLSTILPSLGFKVIGIDLKNVNIRYPDFEFVLADIRKTMFPDSYFDAAVAVSVIEHVGLLEGDIKGDQGAFEELKRILKPEGLLILTVPCSEKERIEFGRVTQRIYTKEGLKTSLNKYFRTEHIEYVPEAKICLATTRNNK